MGRRLLAKWALYILALGAIVGVFTALSRNEYALRNKNNQQVQRRNDTQQHQSPLVGAAIHALHGRNFSNEEVLLDLSHRKSRTLLLITSPVCPFCRVNFHNWREVLRGVPKDEVVWVDVTGKADTQYRTLFGIPSEATFVRLLPDDVNLENLSVTPTTLLLDANGVVRWEWSGMMGEEQVVQLRNLLQVRP